jgi:hypothetical protein
VIAGPGKPGRSLEVHRVILVAFFSKELDAVNLFAVAADRGGDFDELALALLELEIEVVVGVDGLAHALLTSVDINAHDIEAVVLQVAEDVRDFANLVRAGAADFFVLEVVGEFHRGLLVVGIKSIATLGKPGRPERVTVQK